MPNTARINDLWIGECCCHDDPTCIPMVGYIITGSPTIISTGSNQARLFDMTIGECGHTGLIISGSPTVFGNNLNKAIINSSVIGCNIGLVLTGSNTHITGSDI